MRSTKGPPFFIPRGPRQPLPQWPLLKSASERPPNVGQAPTFETWFGLQCSCTEYKLWGQPFPEASPTKSVSKLYPWCDLSTSEAGSGQFGSHLKENQIEFICKLGWNDMTHAQSTRHYEQFYMTHCVTWCLCIQYHPAFVVQLSLILQIDGMNGRLHSLE